MTVPNAPKEGDGGKILFLMWDNGGVNAPAIFRAYQNATLNSEAVGEMGVYPTSGTLEHGSCVMAAGAREVIGGDVPCQGVLVKAYSDNAATVYVGKTGVTADKNTATSGYPLEPGETTGVPCRNVNEVYIIGTGTDGVAWMASAD